MGGSRLLLLNGPGRERCRILTTEDTRWYASDAAHLITIYKYCCQRPQERKLQGYIAVFIYVIIIAIINV
jgi:hypothetical protein